MTPWMLINRQPKRGGFAKYEKHILSRFRVLDLKKADESKKDTLLSAFADVATAEYPCLTTQLALNTPRDALTSEQTERLAGAFDGLETQLGEGFSPRRTVDRAVLSVLDIPSVEQDELLGRLYPMLLNELVTLKQMMG